MGGFEGFLKDLDLSHTRSQLVIIDEIGKMESLSEYFIDEVTSYLNSTKPMVATIAMKGDGFISQVRKRSDCRLVTATRANHDSLADDFLPVILGQLR